MIDVVLIGAMIAGFVPSPTAIIASAVVTAAARMAKTLQSNKRFSQTTGLKPSESY